ATVVKISDLATMARKSEVIVQAKVLYVSIKEDTDGRIVTLTTLQVIDAFKGAKKNEIKTIYQVGGQFKNKVLQVMGAHKFTKNEEMFFFAMSLGDMLVSYGVGLGKFRILPDKNQFQVVEDLHDLVVLKNGGTGDNYEAPIPRRYPSVGEFKNALSSAMSKPEYSLLEIKPMYLKNH
ncbi:MAG: hypothetical protein O2897_03190, partial [bacterium]|nr:hypothetical protein [bacterium]